MKSESSGKSSSNYNTTNSINSFKNGDSSSVGYETLASFGS